MEPFVPPDLTDFPLDVGERLVLDPGAVLFARAAAALVPALLAEIAKIAARSPFRHFIIPGGRPMSVAMTSCGTWGWIADTRGYRYSPSDPASGAPWPPLPPLFLGLAQKSAEAAGFPGFVPDSCLINRYAIGARMGPHQDRDEHDLDAPIVSVSLGLAAVFLWGGRERRAPLRRVPLGHGDVVVWGGPARLHFHGIAPLKPGEHPLTGPYRYNLTFRRAR